MASSSSVGNASSTNASSAQAFYTHFRAATDSLLARLSDGVTTAELVQQSLQTYSSLSGELTRAVDSGVLPSHDQAVYKRTLEEIAAALEVKSAQTQRKSRAGFAFKRKQPTVAAAHQPPTTAARSTDKAALEPLSGLPQSSALEAVQGRQSSHLTIAAIHDSRYTHSTSTSAQAAPAANTPICVDVTHISNSIVDLRPIAATHSILAVQIRAVTHSALLLPPIEGSVMIHSLSHSLLSIPSCHQFRMHDSNDAVVELSTKRGSVVTIEACTNLTFVTNANDAVKVQDFDDLINSNQLRHPQATQTNANFSVVQSGDDSNLATKIDSSSSTTETVKACIDRVVSGYVDLA